MLIRTKIGLYKKYKYNEIYISTCCKGTIGIKEILKNGECTFKCIICGKECFIFKKDLYEKYSKGSISR